jgi:ubiquinone/menaquinone biosynthesis C-methylase UbiE
VARVDYDRMAADYDRGRALAPDGLDGWRDAVAGWLPPPGGRPVLDLGAGTGLFAVALAEWTGTRVVALEPSAGMRQQGRRHPLVAWIGGAAQRLPLAAGSCGAAWASTVLHHLGDLPGCARELRRVVEPGGTVLVRGAFPGRLDGITMFRFFPGARRVAETFPTVEAVVAAFATAGFAAEAPHPVPQVSAASLRASLDQVRLRADTTLQALADDEFAAGLAALERAAAETPPAPVVDHLDLLVLR